MIKSIFTLLIQNFMKKNLLYNYKNLTLALSAYLVFDGQAANAQCPVNDQTVTPATSSINCSGSTTIDVGSTQSGVNYYLINNTNSTVVGGQIAGNGSPISLPTGTIDETTIYSVYAANPSNGVNFSSASLQYATDPTPVGLPTGNVVTVEAWVYPVSYPDGTYNGVVSYGPRNCSPSGRSFLLSMTNQGRPSMATWCNDFVPTTGPTANLNQWNHIACVLNGTSVKLYLNGYEWSGTLGINPDIISGTLNIGCTDNPGRNFNGRIDDVRIWNYARTKEEIDQQKLTCLTGTEPGLVSYFKFEEGAGTSVADIAGTNTLTLVNGASWVSGSDACSPCFATMTQSATVNIFDDPATVASSPGNFSVNIAPGTCGAVVTYTAPTFDDDCDGTGLSGVLMSGASTASGQTFSAGITTVSYMYTDSEGNETTETFQVTVVDNEAPVITNCPSDMTFNATQPGCSETLLWLEPMGEDVCAGFITAVSSHNSGDNFTEGITTVTYTFNDGNGNESTCDFDVEIINPLVGSSIDQMISCFGSNDGAIDVSLSGAVDPVSYYWTDGVSFSSTDEDLTNLAPGTYDVVATDAIGCTASGSITITEPTELEIFVDAALSPTGCGLSDGSISITASGGTESGTYDYSWSDGGSFSSTFEDLIFLPSGNYTVEVTDDNGCVSTEMISLNDPDGATLSINASSFLNLDCNGDSDGTIDLDVTLNGGATSATYDWDYDGTGDNDDIEDLNGLSAGTYSITVIDDNGCSSSISATVNEPAELIANGTSSDELFGNDGSIDLTVNGGTAPYTFDWTDSGSFTSTDEDLSDLSAGTYVVTVTDANGCTTITTVVVSSQVGIEEEDINALTVYPNPSTGIVFINTNMSDIENIQIIDASGRILMTILEFNTVIEADLSQLEKGVYFIRVNGAQKMTTATVIIE